MKNVKYRVVATGLKNGETPLCRFAVVHNGSVRDDAVYSRVAQKSGQPIPLVKATYEMVMAEIKEMLKHGYRVEMPGMSALLSLPGTVESTSVESRKAANLKLVAHLAAKGEFKTCCQGPEFVLENITKGATVVVDNVVNGISSTPNVLTNGVNVEVHVVGNGLYMPDLDDPTVGAYIAGSDGTVLVKATVTESTATSLVCTFAQIDLQEGTYKFCVASRNGFDPELYGVTIGKRNIRVVDAVQNEEAQNG